MSRNIVITGASSAIGAAICRRIIQPEDSALLHCCRNESACKTLAAELPAECQVVSADLADPKDLADLCAMAAETDILINCAAVTRTGLLAQLTDDDLDTMVATNVTALVKLCRAVIPAMLIKRAGCIVNVSSVAANRGNPGQAAYAGTKGFMEAFTRSLAAEYGARGIRANCVAPGAIDAGSLKELLAQAPEEVRQSCALKRLGNADDVAATVAFLCSADASFISGETVSVSGGFCRGV